jgi:predicted Zn-dependent protease
MTQIEITNKFADEFVKKYKTKRQQYELNKILNLLKESHDEKDSNDLDSNVIAIRELG